MSSENVSVGHVGLPVANPRELALFYSNLLGLEQSKAGSIPPLGEYVFLSRRAEDELPLIALFTEPKSRHIAIEIESLVALKNVYARSKAKGIPVSFVMTHGSSLSLYFHDPEGNMLEVFWATGVKPHEPTAEPIKPDVFELPEQEILDLIGVPA